MIFERSIINSIYNPHSISFRIGVHIVHLGRPLALPNSVQDASSGSFGVLQSFGSFSLPPLSGSEDLVLTEIGAPFGLSLNIT